MTQRRRSEHESTVAVGNKSRKQTSRAHQNHHHRHHHHHNYKSLPKAAGGNGCGLLTRTRAAAAAAVQSMVLVTRVVENLGQSSYEPLPEPMRAQPLISSKKSQCFHYQQQQQLPMKYNSSGTMQQTTTTTPSNSAPVQAHSTTILSSYKFNEVISRTWLRTSVAASQPIVRPAHRRAFCHFLFTLSLVASLCVIGVVQCAPTTTTGKLSAAIKAGDNSQQAKAHLTSSPPSPLIVIELAGASDGRPEVLGSGSGEQEEKRRQVEDEQSQAVSSSSADETILLVLADSLMDNSRASTIRRLIKRSGISDQRLAEIQMIRALKKQLERASKIAASNLNSAGQEESSSS